MRRILRLALLFLALLAAGPAIAEWRDIAYSDMVKMPLLLKKIDPQAIFTPYFRAVPGKGETSLPADLQVQVKTGMQLMAVPVRPDGQIELPIRQDWLDAGATVQVNQPKGRIGLSFGMNSRIPPGTRMTYGQLTEAVPVLERGIKEMAGMLSFMAPKVKEVVLKFEKGTAQTATLTLPNGKQKVWKTDAEGAIRLPWEPDWVASPVVLSAPLKGVDQVIK